MALDYKMDVQIDETALDVEWFEQSSLAMRYGTHYAFCKRKLIEAEEKVKFVRSQLTQRANKFPMKCCKKDKPTGPDIEAYYRTHEDHIAAKDAWIAAQYECDIAEIAKNEISFTRKSALENLVKLYLGGYFAGPSVPRNIIKEMKSRKQEQSEQRKVDAGISSKLQRKNKPNA
jgi:hypothetical protein